MAFTELVKDIQFLKFYFITGWTIFLGNLGNTINNIATTTTTGNGNDDDDDNKRRKRNAYRRF